MLATITSIALLGLDGQLVNVEVDVSSGMPAFEIVGLPDAAVRESKERVRASIKNSGFDFPIKRITVNLAPADLKKEGSVFDLPIALGILKASSQVTIKNNLSWAITGELSLDGSVRPVKGILPMAEVSARAGVKNFMAPIANAKEAALIKQINTCGVINLRQALDILEKKEEWQPTIVDFDKIWEDSLSSKNYGDFAEVKGQKMAKRALEITAAGGHNIIMVGSPGSGKSMLAQRLGSILPPLSLEEALLITKIHSIAGFLPPDKPLITNRPFRAPHHTASAASIIGGGRFPRPGEVSLASGGVLFLDELPEYRRDILEALRQPLEDKIVTVSRISAAITYPASFILVAAMNPCPCGFLGDDTKECQCTPIQIQRYRHKISGPIWDRIDLQVEVPRLKYEEIHSSDSNETSAQIRKRVLRAREIQKKRFKKYKGNESFNNSLMERRDIEYFCQLDQKGKDLLEKSFKKLGLSMRAHDRILKVARTIADLDDSEKILVNHLAEALAYRMEYNLISV